MLLGEIVEQPSGSVPMRMSDLDSTLEQEPVVESSQGPLGMSDLDSTPEQEPVVESSIGLGETDGEEEGEDGETLGQGDGLGSNQFDDTAGTMNIDKLNTDSVESKEEGDAAPQPGGKKKAKKNTTRRKQLYQKK